MASPAPSQSPSASQSQAASSPSRPTSGTLFTPTLTSEWEREREREKETWKDKKKGHAGKHKERVHQQQQSHGQQRQSKEGHQQHHHHYEHKTHKDRKQQQQQQSGKPVTFLTPPRILLKKASEAPVQPDDEAELKGKGEAVDPSNAAVINHESGSAQNSHSTPIRIAVNAKQSSAAPVLVFHRVVQLCDGRMQVVGKDALHGLLRDAPPNGHVTSTSTVDVGGDFSVIGVVGLQGCGKSTIINALARRHQSGTACAAEPSKTADPSQLPSFTFIGGPSTRPAGFRTATRADILRRVACTHGMDVLVTPERNLLIDTPPLNSVSVLADLIAKDQPLPPSTTIEQMSEMHAMQTLLLLLQCCQIILVVSDNNQNHMMQTWRLLQRALVMRQHLTVDCVLAGGYPSSSSRSAASSPSTSIAPLTPLPDLVFVVNKVPLSHMAQSPSSSHHLTEVLARFFTKQPFRKHGWISNDTPFGGPSALPVDSRVNCFQLPLFLTKPPATHSKSSSLPLDASEEMFGMALEELASQLLTMKKLPMKPNMTEREWLRHVLRVVHDLHHTSAMSEYRTLIDAMTPKPKRVTVLQRPRTGSTITAGSSPATPGPATASSSAQKPSSARPHYHNPYTPPKHHSREYQHQQPMTSPYGREAAPSSEGTVRTQRRLYEPPT